VVGGPVSDNFHTVGTTPSDGGTGVGIAGSDPLVMRDAGTDRGDTGAGKAVG
jgi:hypothetical protein